MKTFTTLALALCGLLVSAGSASAISVATVQLGGATAFYHAGWNEQNHVRVWLSSEGHMIIYDSGAPLVAIASTQGLPDMCTQLGSHSVDCGTATNLDGSLNNLDDWASFDIFKPNYSVYWNGGSGQDFLRGGAGSDTLVGDGNSLGNNTSGPFTNEIAYGRGGNDTITSTYYADGGTGIDHCWVFTGGTKVNCEG